MKLFLYRTLIILKTFFEKNRIKKTLNVVESFSLVVNNKNLRFSFD